LKFWDSSALVPLIIEERHSKACRQILRTDPTQIAFCFTRTEILSVIWRRHREGLLDAAGCTIGNPETFARVSLLAGRVGRSLSCSRS
jgi:hypothetical protein